MKEQIALAFKVDQATVDALDAIAERLAAENFSGRPNRTAALRYAVSVATKEVASTEKKSKKTNN